MRGSRVQRLSRRREECAQGRGEGKAELSCYVGSSGAAAQDKPGGEFRGP